MSIDATGRIDPLETGGQIVIERTFSARIGDVWRSIAEPEQLERWIGTWSGDAGENRRVTFRMTAEAGAQDEEVLIHRCDPPHLLDVESSQNGMSWRMIVELEERDGGTRLTFRQPVEDLDGAATFGPGWEYYLDRLVAVHTGAAFAPWEEYYPAQLPYWDEQIRATQERASA